MDHHQLMFYSMKLRTSISKGFNLLIILNVTVNFTNPFFRIILKDIRNKVFIFLK